MTAILIVGFVVVVGNMFLAGAPETIIGLFLVASFIAGLLMEARE